MVRREIIREKSEQGNPTLLLKYKKPFDFNQINSFMSQRAIAGVESVTKNSYARTFRTDNAKGFFIVTDNPGESALELRIDCDNIKCYMEICNRVRRMFDLDTDFSMINKQFAKDEHLAKGMRDGHVPRLPVAFDPFEFVIRAVLGQQISVKAATTLAARLAEKAGIKSKPGSPPGLDYFFPNPSELLKLDIDGIGIAKIRETTIKNAVRALLNKDFILSANQTFEKFYKDFSAIKGIGDWTVNYVAMRGLGMFDSFPAGDLGIVKALAKEDKKLSKKEITKIAENWRPYRAYAALCLWNRDKNR